MTSDGRLAEYLRARRERTRPEDVGLAVGDGRRRVSGLRREELAALAGISTDYYLRLEQGRDANPSAQVVDALARALRLDAPAAVYLRRLAGHPDGPGADDRAEAVGAATQALIDSWPHTAAFVHNRYLDVLASNALARALNPNYRAGVNSVITLLSDPAEQAFHVDWAGLAERSIALLRSIGDTRIGDARLDAVVAEGSARSARFRELWDRRDVVRVGNGVHRLRHAEIGELELNYIRLPLTGSDGQSIFCYFATPGTPSADALERIGAAGAEGWERQGLERTGERV